MKVIDIMRKLKHYPPDAELVILGPVREDPTMFYVDGVYLLGEFKTNPMPFSLLTPRDKPPEDWTPNEILQDL